VDPQNPIRKNVTKILIAEDDTAVREFASRALVNAGHEVVAAADGLQALEALENDEFDLLLSDIVMPELDGIALALKVSRDWPDLPILLMTGYAAERQRAHNLDALIHDVISKPFTLQQICDAAEKVLDSRS
jgi:two-component system cell cycle response regulator CpdR